MFFHPIFLKAHGQYWLASGRASLLCLQCVLAVCTAPACWAVIHITVLHLLLQPFQAVAEFFRTPLASAVRMGCSTQLPGGAEQTLLQLQPRVPTLLSHLCLTATLDLSGESRLHLFSTYSHDPTGDPWSLCAACLLLYFPDLCGNNTSSSLTISVLWRQLCS